jgi:hypothetical protein
MDGVINKIDLHSDSLKEFTIASTGWKDIYGEGAEDEYFVAGNQWPSDILAERTEAKRPTPVFNKLWKFIKNVQGDQKQNRPQIKVLPSDSNSDPIMAEILQDIIRHIEYKSQADVVYDTGFNQCLSSSVGFWRVISKYEDGETFNQCLRIELIPNQYSVLFDPKAKDPMFTDAKYVYLSTWLSKDEFEHKYKDKDKTSWPTEGIQDINEGWWEEEKIRVAEKYYKKIRKVKIAQLSNGIVTPITKEVRRRIEEEGLTIEQERTAEIEEIWWCKMSGTEILEGPTKQPGSYLPIIPVLGDVMTLEGKRKIFSLIRHAKDPQRMLNYWRATEIETVALQPKAPYKLTSEQIEGYEKYWREAASSNKPFLVYNHIEGHPVPQREAPPTYPTGAASQSDRANSEIYETIGITDSSLGEKSNERSGKALAMRQRSADKSVFSFFDNHARAIAHTGKVLVDLIPHYYDNERVIMIQGDDEQLKELVINKAGIDEDLEEVIWNDMANAGKYDVVLAAGASYQTKRQEMIELYQQAIQYAPDFIPVLLPKLISMADGPGAQELAKELAGLAQQRIQQEASGTPGAGMQQQAASPSP